MILNVVYFSVRSNLLTLRFHRPLWWSCLPLTCMVNSFPNFPGLSEPAIVLGKPERTSGVVLHLRRIYMSRQKSVPFNTAWLQIYSTIWCLYKRVLWRSVAPQEKKHYNLTRGARLKGKREKWAARERWRDDDADDWMIVSICVTCPWWVVLLKLSFLTCKFLCFPCRRWTTFFSGCRVKASLFHCGEQPRLKIWKT